MVQLPGRKNGFSEKGWTGTAFYLLGKISKAFYSDTILFFSVTVEFYVIFIWKKKLEGNIQAWRFWCLLDYVINISN